MLDQDKFEQVRVGSLWARCPYCGAANSWRLESGLHPYAVHTGIEIKSVSVHPRDLSIHQERCDSCRKRLFYLHFMRIDLLLLKRIETGAVPVIEVGTFLYSASLIDLIPSTPKAQWAILEQHTRYGLSVIHEIGPFRHEGLSSLRGPMARIAHCAKMLDSAFDFSAEVYFGIPIRPHRDVRKQDHLAAEKPRREVGLQGASSIEIGAYAVTAASVIHTIRDLVGTVKDSLDIQKHRREEKKTTVSTQTDMPSDPGDVSQP